MTQTIGIPSGENETVALVSLSPREIDILTFIEEGRGPCEIADELGLTEKTVRNNVFRLCQGLWLNSRVDLMIWARQNPQAKEGKPARAGLRRPPALDKAA